MNSIEKPFARSLTARGNKTRRQMSYEEWLEEGRRRFPGLKMRYWKFECPSCGHVQCAMDFAELGFDLEKIAEKGWPYYSCIGRWKPDAGCDWTLGGLLQIHTLEVILEGKARPVFEFAEVELPKEAA